MTIPHAPRIAVLVLATTAFYGYVGQMVPQSEVQPPEEIAIRADLTTPEMVEVGREIAEGKGLCRTCHTIGQSGALRFPDLAGVAGRAAERVPGLSALDYFAQSLYEPDAFVVPGFNPGMPTINRPPIGLTDQEILCVIAYLESLGGTPTVTLQTSHRYYAAPATPGAAPPDAAAGAPVTTPAGPGPTPPTPGTTPPVPGAAPDQKPEPGEQLPLTGPPPAATAPRRAPRERSGYTMNILVVVAVVAAFGLLRFRRANLLVWAVAWWAGIYVLLRFGFTVPIPASVISIYMGIVSLAILAYLSSSQERRDEVSRPLVRFMTEKRYTAFLAALAIAIPALAAANVYVQMNVPVEPPFFPRTIHPASPSEIRVQDKTIPIDAGDNPFRQLETSNPEEFRRHVENGRQVYYRNCVFCHGDNLGGNGMFAHGLNPIPTNFADGQTLPNLSETFLFWRISKGGPGMPEEGAPWDTAMPAWEKFLKEEEMWDVILFLYDFTGERPAVRALEEGEH